MNRLSTDKRTAVIAALVEGTSVNAACRITGAAKHTVLKLLKDMALLLPTTIPMSAISESGAYKPMRFGLSCTARIKNLTLEQVQAGAGSVWTWTAIDADTKLIISYTLGDRGADTAKAFIQDVASRITNRILLTTDGHRVCADAVEDAFGSEIDYAMLVKIYGASNDNPESRYSPAGNPDPEHISTSFAECQKLSMRMGMRRFTRLTNGFSKKLENHGHMVALYFLHYNFCRVHNTLRVTPAMEAGLTDHIWDLEELLEIKTWISA